MAALYPSAHVALVAYPVRAEDSVQLLFFPPDHDIHCGNIDRCKDQSDGRSQYQRGPEKDEHVSAEIKWVSRKAIRAGGHQSPLRRDGDDFHPVPIEDVCGPDAKEKTGGQQQPSQGTDPDGVKAGDTKKQIQPRSDEGEKKSHARYANIVEDAFEKVYRHSDASMSCK